MVRDAERAGGGSSDDTIRLAPPRPGARGTGLPRPAPARPAPGRRTRTRLAPSALTALGVLLAGLGGAWLVLRTGGTPPATQDAASAHAPAEAALPAAARPAGGGPAAAAGTPVAGTPVARTGAAGTGAPVGDPAARDAPARADAGPRAGPSSPAAAEAATGSGTAPGIAATGSGTAPAARAAPSGTAPAASETGSGTAPGATPADPAPEGTTRTSIAPSPPAPPLPAPAAPPLATEAGISAMAPGRRTLLRLAENPAVFVLLFPDLESQGAAMNRIAALVEKAGLPRDRVLADGDLAAAIARAGEQPATWYYGHDYGVADLARFFALAERDGVALNEAERWLQAQLPALRALLPEGQAMALVSVADPDHRVDAAMRAAILRHEIGHGHFLTAPAVAAHALLVWRNRFGAAEREALRAFLAREGYDTGNEALMANEALAYLLFTPDPRLFDARHLGIGAEALERMRTLMREGLPPPAGPG